MDFRAYIVFASIVTLAAIFFSPVLARAWRKMRGQGIAFALIAAGFLVSMATKPNVTWDDYLQDDGTCYTNGNAAVAFKWVKKSATVSDATTVTISQKPNGGETWTDVASTTVGAKYYRLAIDSTNYAWYVWTSYVPPEPVHTNGVWLGTILEKAKGSAGTDKLLIINGQLLQNGKVIAP